MSLQLAPGVTFDEAKHEYWHKGKKLSGITGMVSKKLGLKYDNAFVSEHAEEGIHVHKAIQRWIEAGNPESVHPGVQWLVNTFESQECFKRKEDSPRFWETFSEVLVSDKKQYASAVDIVCDFGIGLKEGLVLWDIKKGVFKREYVTWQLSVYKYLIEKFTNFWVHDCICACLKDKEYYPIFPKPAGEVEKLLYGVAA